MQQSELRESDGEHCPHAFVRAVRVLGWLFFGLFNAAFAVDGFTQPNYISLKKQGDEIRAQLEDYHQIHGDYPLTAEAGAIELPVTQFGRWQYEYNFRESETLITDGRVVEIPATTSFTLRLSTKGRPRTLLEPYFTLSWRGPGLGARWKINTTRAC
jgi:hypothetical protein